MNIDAILNSIDRGDAARILPDLKATSPFARSIAAVDASEQRARAALAEPIPALPWSLLRLFVDTGDRALFETPYFARRKALTDLEVSILAGRDTDGSLLTALHDLLWAMCDEYSWAVPAHFFLKRPIPVTLDLFASETGLYIAEVLHLLGDRLDSRVITRCRAEIKRRILDSFLGDYPHEWWEQGTNNWGAVCAGSVGITFLYEETVPSRRRAALARILATMDAFLTSFPPDGTCLEGVGYWEYGFGFFTLFADFVHQYTDGAVDLFDDPRARRIALFPQSVALSPSRTISFADGSRFYSAGSAATTILHRHYGDAVRLCPTDFSRPAATMPSAKPAMLLRNLLWNNPDRPADPLPDITTYLSDAQWLVVRHAPFAFAALFGNNGAPHNHNDIGSFLLVDGDEEGPMDLGSGRYTRQYFSPERYTILCNGSQGHSVPIVGGALQKDGGRFHATDVIFREEAGEVVFSGDIAGAYGFDALASLRRTFHVRPEDGTASVTDTFAFNGEPLSVTERFVGYAKAEITGPGEARFGAFRATFDPALEASVHTEPMEPHGRMQGSGNTRMVFFLDIEVPAGTAKFEIAFARGQP
jgi:hypothetical protein